MKNILMILIIVILIVVLIDVIAENEYADYEKCRKKYVDYRFSFTDYQTILRGSDEDKAELTNRLITERIEREAKRGRKWKN